MVSQCIHLKKLFLTYQLSQNKALLSIRAKLLKRSPSPIFVRAAGDRVKQVKALNRFKNANLRHFVSRPEIVIDRN